MRRSSVLLMPSRTEGFGLVAIEALSLGIPVLVSNQSGVGELLINRLGTSEAIPFVVRTTGDLQTDAAEWARALENTLRDRNAAFRRTAELCDKLANAMSWETAAGALMNALRHEERSSN